MLDTSNAVSVGDTEHDLELVRMWTGSARRAAGLWMHGLARARSSQRLVEESLTELRRICLEIEQTRDLELSICVWEAILVVVHLRDALGAEDKDIVGAAVDLLASRERAIDSAIDSVKPAEIHDRRSAA